MSLIETAVLTPLQAVGRIPDLIRSGRSTSMVDYTRSTRSEPITLVSQSLVTYPNMNEILQCIVSIYCGFYLQAIAIAANVGRVDIIRTLDKVNPNRDPIEAGGLWIDSAFSNESYQLPGLPAKLHTKPALEAFRDHESDVVTRYDRNAIDVAMGASSLAVGKVFNVEISDQGETASIPVSVRLMVRDLEQGVICNILSDISANMTVKESFYGIKSGRRKLVEDGIFACDLIREHRKTLMKDKSGMYAEILKRAGRNRLSGVLSLNPSVATASNIVVLSKEDARVLEGTVRGKLKDYRTRKPIFDNSKLMLMVVVDDGFDMVNIYYDGIEQGTKLSVRDAKTLNKGNNLDVAEITRLLMLGQAPRY